MKIVLGLVGLMMLVCVPTFAQSQAPIRVNCGGNGYVDSKGQAWQGDTGYNVGTASANSNAISGTTDPKLFQSGRWNGTASTPMTYTFPVAGGTYHVNLYFAESTAGLEHAGYRVFNVRMQDQLVLQNLDIYATAGANTALIESADISVTNGQMKIQFDNVVQNPKVNAIEIVQTSSAPTMTMNFLYPDGSPVSGTLNYQMATQQLSLGGNSPLTNGQAICYLFTSPGAMGLVGTIQVNLSLTDTTGKTLWQVSMAMDPAAASFSSVQSSSLNVIVAKN